MPRRDLAFACLAWGGLLAGLVWALCTQVKWVRENKPIQIQRPPGGPVDPEPVPTNATGVVGTIDDDTRSAMARNLQARKPKQADPAPRGRPRKAAPKKSAATSE